MMQKDMPQFFHFYKALNIVLVWLICPESHVWMLLKKKDEVALESLTKLRGCVKVASCEIEQIKKSQDAARSNQASEGKTFAYKCRHAIKNDKCFESNHNGSFQKQVSGQR